MHQACSFLIARHHVSDADMGAASVDIVACLYRRTVQLSESHTRLASCLQRRALSPFGNRTKEEGEVKSKPTKAKLGEKSSFYYDEAVRAAAGHKTVRATPFD